MTRKGLLADVVLYQKLSSIMPSVYPIVAENGTYYPFIVYTRDSVTPHSLTKDGYGDDEVNITVKVVSDKYDTVVSYAQQVRDTLTYDWISILHDTSTITSQCQFTGAYESWESDAYVQSLTFTMFVK